MGTNGSEKSQSNYQEKTYVQCSYINDLLLRDHLYSYRVELPSLI